MEQENNQERESSSSMPFNDSKINDDQNTKISMGGEKETLLQGKLKNQQNFSNSNKCKIILLSMLIILFIIIIAAIIFLILNNKSNPEYTENILEFSLYKKNSYDYSKNFSELINEIDKSNFLTDLTLGSNKNKYPLQIEMSQKDICLPKHPKEELITLNKKSININLENSEDWTYELNNNSQGILGFSLNEETETENTTDNKFITQLTQNNITNNSVYFFEFEKNSQISNIKNYLNQNAKLIIGDYPYNIYPKKYNKNKTILYNVTQQIIHEEPILLDTSSQSIMLEISKCVGCSLCARACSTVAGQNVLQVVIFNNTNSNDTSNKKKLQVIRRIQTVSGQKLADTNCISCGQCTLVCPVNAIHEIDSISIVENILKNKGDKVITCQIAPALRINMAEDLEVEPGTISQGKLVTALKILGFDYVFDTNFAADMTILEESTEFIKRLSNNETSVLPLFTSCCPSWVNFIEKSKPELIPHLSSCKSPLNMLSTVIKSIFPQKIHINSTQIFNVAIMPCTAKKEEIKRYQLNNNTDAVITSRELASMIKNHGINFSSLNETELDTVYSEYTGGGAIFCATGGVAESLMRTTYRLYTGKDMDPIDLIPVRGYEQGIKIAKVDMGNITVNLAVVHGIENAIILLNKIKNKEIENVHLIECMACPGGCVMGGGSPKAKGDTEEKRINATYYIDENKNKRVSIDNEQLNNLYNESFDGYYGSEKAIKFLHTFYTNKRVEKSWNIFFEKVLFNGKNTSSDNFTKGIIKVEKNFISAPKYFVDVIQKEFLDFNKNDCVLENAELYKFIVCNDSFDINNFPKLEFYSEKLNHSFILDGNDLFVKDSDKKQLLSLIVFSQFKLNETNWELGLPFLRKENFYFDLEEKVIGICVEENENFSLSVFISYNLTLSIWIFVAIMLFIIITVFITIMKFNKGKEKRKPRVNEIAEDSEYIEAEDK